MFLDFLNEPFVQSTRIQCSRSAVHAGICLVLVNICPCDDATSIHSTELTIEYQ